MKRSSELKADIEKIKKLKALQERALDKLGKLTDDSIAHNAKKKKAVIKYPEDCMCCDYCELDCPKKAIYVSPERYSPVMVSW